MPSSRRIRVVLAIDTDLVLTGVQQAVAQARSIEIVGEAHDGEAALVIACEQAADVLLLSCPLGGTSASALAAQLGQAGLSVRLLVLAAPDDEMCLRSMLASGVLGYVVYTESARAMVTAIRIVARGQPYFSPDVRPRLVDWAAQAVAGPAELDTVSGTEQERAILDGLARGWDNARIAATVGVAERTVRYHLRKLIDRAGVRSRTELALWAVEHGLGKDT